MFQILIKVQSQIYGSSTTSSFCDDFDSACVVTVLLQIWEVIFKLEGSTDTPIFEGYDAWCLSSLLFQWGAALARRLPRFQTQHGRISQEWYIEPRSDINTLVESLCLLCKRGWWTMERAFSTSISTIPRSGWHCPWRHATKSHSRSARQDSRLNIFCGKEGGHCYHVIGIR